MPNFLSLPVLPVHNSSLIEQKIERFLTVLYHRVYVVCDAAFFEKVIAQLCDVWHYVFTVHLEWLSSGSLSFTLPVS